MKHALLGSALALLALTDSAYAIPVDYSFSASQSSISDPAFSGLSSLTGSFTYSSDVPNTAVTPLPGLNGIFYGHAGAFSNIALTTGGQTAS